MLTAPSLARAALNSHCGWSTTDWLLISRRTTWSSNVLWTSKNKLSVHVQFLFGGNPIALSEEWVVGLQQILFLQVLQLQCPHIDSFVSEKEVGWQLLKLGFCRKVVVCICTSFLWMTPSGGVCAVMHMHALSCCWSTCLEDRMRICTISTLCNFVSDRFFYC